MSDLALNSSGDIFVTGQDLTLVTLKDAIGQHLSQRLQLFKGESFVDNRKGMAYLQVLGKKINPVEVDFIFINEIINTPGVLELLRLDINIDPQTRAGTVDFKVRTTDGIIDFTQVI